MEIEVLTKTTRKPDTIKGEINSLSTLVKKREEWLESNINKHKTTYKAVFTDTEQMKGKLALLKEEYETLINNL